MVGAGCGIDPDRTAPGLWGRWRKTAPSVPFFAGRSKPLFSACPATIRAFRGLVATDLASSDSRPKGSTAWGQPRRPGPTSKRKTGRRGENGRIRMATRSPLKQRDFSRAAWIRDEQPTSDEPVATRLARFVVALSPGCVGDFSLLGENASRIACGRKPRRVG